MKTAAVRPGACASAGVVVLAALLAAACSATPSAATGAPTTSPATPSVSASAAPPTQSARASTVVLREFDSHRIRLDCRGDGSPTVVLEYGIGGGVYPSWIALRTLITPFARVCVYERFDTGESPPTPVDIAASLHDVLEEAAGPPYVVVGHSWGAIYMRVFTHEFPDDVVGLVLVDPSHPEQHARFLDALGPAASAEPASVARARDEIEAATRDPHFVVSAEQVMPATSLGDRPLAVLTARFGGPELPADAQDALADEWLELHEELAALSSNRVHVLATESGHNIPLDQPRLVVEAIRQVAEAAGEGTPLPPCGTELEEQGGACLP